MKSLRMLGLTALSFGFLAMLVCPAEGQEGKGKLTPTDLVGTWKYVSGMRAGKSANKEILGTAVTVSKDAFTVPAGKEKFVIQYTLNTKESPIAVDLDITDGPEKGKALGIIAVEGEMMKLCYVPMMKDKKATRPTKFESTESNGAFFFVLKRDK